MDGAIIICSVPNDSAYAGFAEASDEMLAQMSNEMTKQIWTHLHMPVCGSEHITNNHLFCAPDLGRKGHRGGRGCLCREDKAATAKAAKSHVPRRIQHIHCIFTFFPPLYLYPQLQFFFRSFKEHPAITKRNFMSP